LAGGVQRRQLPRHFGERKCNSTTARQMPAEMYTRFILESGHHTALAIAASTKICPRAVSGKVAGVNRCSSPAADLLAVADYLLWSVQDVALRTELIYIILLPIAAVDFTFSFLPIAVVDRTVPSSVFVLDFLAKFCPKHRLFLKIGGSTN